MRVHNSVVSSLRKTLASYRENRARHHNTAVLLSEDLSPSARQEIIAILARGTDAQAPVTAPRSVSARQKVGAGALTSH